MRNTRRAAVAAALALVTLTSCAHSGADRVFPGAAAVLNGSTPAARGDVPSIDWTIAQGEPMTLDWLHSANYPSNTILANMCESLYRLNPDFSVSPGLAEKTERPDPSTLVYTVRDGATFWDGNPVTAEDVAFSLGRNLDEKAGSFWVGAFANVASIDATGPRQVTVKFTKPDTMFDPSMAAGPGIVVEKAHFRQAGKGYGTPDGGLMCSGPFKFDHWERGNYLRMTRNDAYWDPKHRAHAEKFTFKFITDPITTANALTAGELDGVYDAPLEGLVQLGKSSEVDMTYGSSMQMIGLVVGNPTSLLATDPKLRDALRLSIDYQGIVDVILKGAGEPLKTITPPATWGTGPAADVYRKAYDALPAPRYDLDAARATAKEAGNPGRPIVIAVPAEQLSAVQIVSAIQSGAQRAGIDVEIKAMPLNSYGELFSDPKAREGIDAFFTINYPDFPEPLQMYQQMALPGRFNNYNGYDNPAVTEALDAATAEPDPVHRAELVAKAQEQITADAPWIPVATPYVRLAQNSRLTGAPATFVYLYYPWAADIGAK
ncbi:ABC transporter substrate-binding protein [Streptomyces sp. SID3343]|uniref:ABC transporter substrate-binding protein n=1 Tax=Streptomyces sp. SID3343 TaxID=2690260 RepID=UPI001370E680|nr:ABC transporter substrate-binding protein [Streptomyces sp. SID3343]MYW03849.1 ABC transporter substrate-binding protein [Streptomyces sp. SID3343]